jgi:hypothetical protein
MRDHALRSSRRERARRSRTRARSLNVVASLRPGRVSEVRAAGFTQVRSVLASARLVRRIDAFDGRHLPGKPVVLGGYALWASRSDWYHRPLVDIAHAVPARVVSHRSGARRRRPGQMRGVIAGSGRKRQKEPSPRAHASLPFMACPSLSGRADTIPDTRGCAPDRSCAPSDGSAISSDHESCASRVGCRVGGFDLITFQWVYARSFKIHPAGADGSATRQSIVTRQSGKPTEGESQ